jgi:ABC-type multidrug transport system fused ATPase/permease subunit
MIAHRLTTVKNADRIMVMNKGKIVEVGNHKSLLENYPNGIYSSYVKKQ